MKINFRILGKAIWEIIKFPLLVLSITFAIFGIMTALFYFMGEYAFPVIVILMGVGIIVVFTYFKYQELMAKHRAEQRQIVDIILK